MRISKWLKSSAAVLLAGGLLLTGCGSTAQSDDSSSGGTGSTVTASADNTAKSSAEAITGQYEEEDTNAAYDESSAVKITLKGSSAETTGEGVKVADNSVTITRAGTYVLSGEYTGSILVQAKDTDLVRLVLNGVTITGDTNAAIYAASADKVIVTVAAGTRNSLSDAKNYTYTDKANEEPDATLFSKVDLSVNGSGSLQVTANYKNGIGTKDDLVLSGVTLQVTASGDALRGRDSISIIDGNYTLQAGSDGLQANNDEDADKGWVYIKDGKFVITADGDGIQAETVLALMAGTYEIETGGGHGAGVADDSASYKGLKSGTDLYIAAGTYELDTLDDAVHANLNMDLSGGEFTVATGDDGFHADNDMQVNAENINITASFEGIEAKTMTIASGDLDITASDDGINISGGNTNDTQQSGKFGGDQFGGGGASEDQWLKVTGGNINIQSGSDCIDINGSAEISGGVITASGPASGAEVAIDYDNGSFVISGGELYASGAYNNMSTNVDESSTQTTLMIIYDSSQTAGSKITIADSSGETVAEFTPVNDFQTALLSTVKLEQGQEYTISTNGTQNFTTTLSQAVSTLSESGETTTAGGGGMGGGPAGQRGGERPQ